MNLILLLMTILTFEITSANATDWVNPNFTYILDSQTITKGGIKSGTVLLGNAVLGFDFDTKQKFSLGDSHFYTSFMAMHGTSPSFLAGDMQLTSNIDTGGINTLKVYELYYEQRLINDKLRVLLGMYDLSQEFNVSDPALFFVHSSPGTSAEFGASGQLGPSIFPFIGPTLRLSLELTQLLYVKTALADGVPSNPNNPYGNYVSVSKKDGTVLVNEVGVAKEGKYKFGLGNWSYSHKLNDLSDVDSKGNPIQRRSSGQYFMADYQFSPQLYPFIRYGYTGENIQVMQKNLVMGFTGQNPIRPNDQYGLMLSKVFFSNKYLSSNPELINDEKTYELSYSHQYNEQMSFMPNLQYIENPSGRTDLENTIVVGLRLIYQDA